MQAVCFRTFIIKERDEGKKKLDNKMNNIVGTLICKYCLYQRHNCIHFVQTEI